MRKLAAILIALSITACKKGENVSNDREISFSNTSAIEDANSTVNDISDAGFPITSYYTGGFFLYSNEPKGNYIVLDSLGNCLVRKRYGTDNDSDRVYSSDTLIFNNCSGSKTFIIQSGYFAGDTARIEWTLNGQIVRSDPNDNDPYIFNIIRGTPNPFQTALSNK